MRILVYWPAGQEGAEFFFEVTHVIDRIDPRPHVRHINVGRDTRNDIETFDVHLFVCPAERSFGASTLQRYAGELRDRLRGKRVAAVTSPAVEFLARGPEQIRQDWIGVGVNDFIVGTKGLARWIRQSES